MQPPLVFGAKATATRNCLHLSFTIPKQLNFSAESATVTGDAFQFKVDPLVLRCDGVLIDKQWTTLVSNHNIEHPSIPEIGESDRASIVSVGNANGLRDVVKLPGAVI